MTRQPIAFALLALAVASGACSPAAAWDAPTTDAAAVASDARLIAAMRATARYRDPAAALADGYVRDDHCVEMPGTGAMGVHFLHPARMGMVTRDGRVHGTDTTIDPGRPELLVYAPREDGSLELAAIEYYVSQEAWGPGPKPTVFGATFDTMQDDPATPDVDEGHGFTPHYDLHVWVWKENPSGMFAQWNPAVTCPAATAAAGHAH